MTMQHDTIVRGGLVIDGAGAEPKVADVAITQGVIQAVCKVEGTVRAAPIARMRPRTFSRGRSCWGFKQSGLGREGGVEGLLPYLETKTMIFETETAAR